MSSVNNKVTTIGTGSINPTTLLTNMSNAIEKNKQWQRELLMERIRSHSSQHKTFQELSKAMRMGMLEKRYALDAVEKSNLQKCLDSMQHCIKVTSRQGLVERLESLSRQLGLKFMDDTKVLFISTDMFFLEIVLDANGALSDVKVHHECKVEQQSCSELVDCLNRGDFADFTAQLEGFSSIYQLNAEPKVKTKAFDAMQAVESDLYNLFQMQSFSKDTQQVLKDSIVGIVLKRHGGHPMRLVYFVSPYDLISLESKSLQSLSLDLLHNKQVGFSVTVNLEASSANKLQILPTVSFAKESQSGLEVPVFAPLNQMNSMLLPATFVLRLNKPLPVCYNTLRAMGLCGSPTTSQSSAADINNSTVLEGQHKATLPMISNIMSLIIYTASEQQLKSSQKGLFVCLPDQTHCYFFTENKLLKSTLVQSIPFTEPSQVPKILDFLKRQALFYALLSSCVRPQSKMVNDIDSTIILEVNAISYHQISVALQHPYEESMATVEFDLHNGNVQCIIYSLSNNYDLLSLKLTNVVQKCCSIPVTIRALLRYWDQERIKKFQRGIGAAAGSTGANTSSNGNNAVGNNTAYGNFNIAGVSNDPGGGGGGVGGGGGGCMNRGLGGSVKMEQALQQRSQLASTTTGYLKYKCGDIKQEDFHESPKSQTLAMVTDTTVANSMPAREVSSLGQQQQQTTHETLQQQANTTFTAEREIADKYKNIWKDKTPAIKNCVSITPIGTQHDPIQDVKRTGSIEIIPLTGQQHNSIAGTVNNGNSTTVSNSSTGITITPINTGSSSMNISGVSSKDKKSSTTSSTCISNLPSSTTSAKRALDVQGELPKEKKRKKKRDDSPMGPPEKIYSRQNSPAGSSEAAAGAVARKFSSPSSSPKGSSGGLLASCVTGSSLTTRPSPKHSPVYSSPKHNTASNSPKSPFGTHSPKHSSSGKPSMSTLKNATVASPKGDKCSTAAAMGSSSSSGLNPAALVRSSTSSTVVAAAAAAAAMAALKNKDKCTVSPSAVSSAAAAAAAAVVKSSMGVVTPTMQQLKSVTGLNHMAAAAAGFGGNTATVNSLDLNAAMRKGVPSAVSLMTSTAVTATINSTPAQRRATQQVHRHHQQRPIPLQPLGSSEGDNHTFNKNSSEYMVKSQSQEGLKLTINKTKAISTKKFGVNNDLTCKKLSASEKSWSPSQSKHTFQKSNSSGNLAGKLNKNKSLENSIEFLSNDNLRKSVKKSAVSTSSATSTHMSSLSAAPSQSALRIDYHADMIKILQYASPTMAASMEGFMKSFNTKFQIPKLSQRNATKTTTATTTAASIADTSKSGSLCITTSITKTCPSSTTGVSDVQAPSLPPTSNASSQQQSTMAATETPTIVTANQSLVSLHVLKSSPISSTSPNHMNSLTATKSALNFVDNSNVSNNSMCNESLLATLAGE